MARDGDGGNGRLEQDFPETLANATIHPDSVEIFLTGSLSSVDVALVLSMCSFKTLKTVLSNSSFQPLDIDRWCSSLHRDACFQALVRVEFRLLEIHNLTNLLQTCESISECGDYHGCHQLLSSGGSGVLVTIFKSCSCWATCWSHLGWAWYFPWERTVRDLQHHRFKRRDQASSTCQFLPRDPQKTCHICTYKDFSFWVVPTICTEFFESKASVYSYITWIFLCSAHIGRCGMTPSNSMPFS